MTSSVVYRHRYSQLSRRKQRETDKLWADYTGQKSVLLDILMDFI